MTNGSFVQQYLIEAKQIIDQLDIGPIDRMAQLLADLRAGGGRLFIVGVGGGAGHASHAVNDFRKIAGIEAYSPSDNVSELTARTNDEGWDTTYAAWLKVSRLVGRDGGYTASVADACVIVPTVNPNAVTPHTESFQAMIWHLLVSDPRLQQMPNKWESNR